LQEKNENVTKTKINMFYIQNVNEALLASQDSKFEHLAVKTVSQEGQSLAFHNLGLRHDKCSHSCYTLMDPPSHISTYFFYI